MKGKKQNPMSRQNLVVAELHVNERNNRKERKQLSLVANAVHSATTLSCGML
jgi:hypothetical protein